MIILLTKKFRMLPINRRLERMYFLAGTVSRYAGESDASLGIYMPETCLQYDFECLMHGLQQFRFFFRDRIWLDLYIFPIRMKSKLLAR